MSDSTLTNPLLRTLRQGGLAASLIVRLFDGPEIGRIAATAGLDALYVDLEHSCLSLQSASRICNAAREAGVTPLVRVPAIDAALIGRVLDGGALGIIAPQVESAADAARAVACCRHPPRGRRSYAGGQAALGYRDVPQAEAMATLDASVLTAVMIESRNALDAVEAIASVDGLDLLFIGAHDLAADLGLAGQWGHPTLRLALARIRQACLDAGKALGLGGLAGQPALLRELAAAPLGCLVSTGTDLACLLGAATQRAAAAHALRGPAGASP
ncbi:aldolase [Achromobacter sp. Marseille-Q0513]|uniref:HpcH/HpaI aldolase family protein n=1 Tax=Achromobacter sp. Marseille-Q0513 TaxID=2829161 RepID=UPI001B96B4BF|nr:aldolase/citrate lyase family protein [Achromobacter sp. Marseille-Q0513]MBR8656037.1 aldolase [Achromobacter sp. Marseille-Q0513]